MTTCQKNHRYVPRFSQLPDSQKPKDGRHLCAGCAYEAGLIDGINGECRNIDELNLPGSQAGTVRHKSAQDAYHLGRDDGAKLAQG